MSVAAARGAYLADEDGYRYVEATPGTPARLRGDVILLHRYRFVLEAVDGEARGGVLPHLALNAD